VIISGPRCGETQRNRLPPLFAVFIRSGHKVSSSKGRRTEENQRMSESLRAPFSFLRAATINNPLINSISFFT
jgi:hypothetical protein